MEAELRKSGNELVFGDVSFSEFVKVGEEFLNPDLLAIDLGFESVFYVCICLEMLALTHDLLS